MKVCTVCREGEMVEEIVPAYHLTLTELPNVFLLDQPIRRCAKCGEQEVPIRGLAKLHRAIAVSVIAQPERLSGEEVRFLRKHLGYSGDDFASIVGVRRATVSDWETGKEPIGGSSDRLLRMLVAKGDQIGDYAAEDLKKITEEKSKAKPLRFRRTGTAWAAEVAR